VPVGRRFGREPIFDVADQGAERTEILAFTRTDVVDGAPPGNVWSRLAPDTNEKHVFDSILLHTLSVLHSRLASVYS
jgi:hypothetical protein